jgi:hypothetical protein
MVKGIAKPPMWFWIVAGLLLLWGLAGCGALYAHIAYGPEMDPAATDWDRSFYASMPGWYNWLFAVATVSGLLGTITLLFRSLHARWLYIISLAGVVLQFGYVLGMTDLIAHKGIWVVYFPAFIIAMGAFQLSFARLAARRGWIG